jgi:hypothetical protein
VRFVPRARGPAVLAPGESGKERHGP